MKIRIIIVALLLCSNLAWAQSGVYLGASSEMHNSLLWGNVDANFESKEIEGAGAITFSAVQGEVAPAGDNNYALTTSPFVGDGAMSEPLSVRQGATLNAGSNALVDAEHLTDAAGYARRWNTTVDMGAYEHQFPRTLTVAIQNTEKWFGQADPQLTYEVTGDGLLPTDSVSVQLTRVAGEATGSYNIDTTSVRVYRLGLPMQDEYTVNVVKGQLTVIPLRNITITTQAVEKYVGEVDPVFTYVLSGDVAADDSVSVQLTRVAGETDGTYNIDTASVSIFKKVGGVSMKYRYNVTVVKGQLTIHALRNITITIAHAGKVEAESDPDFTHELSGNVVDGDSVHVHLTRVAGEAAGIYHIDTASVHIFDKVAGHSTKHRYNIAVVKGSFTITATPVTAVAKNTLTANVYPTVTTGMLYVSGVEGQLKVEVYSVAGALLMSGVYDAGAPIDLSAMPKGTLFVRLTNEGKSLTKQIVKQ